uniref:Uncharacterized protein n=1 Tax=Manihot esculenta TaxID=3983 RepID=A0A2C9U322_MANES
MKNSVELLHQDPLPMIMREFGNNDNHDRKPFGIV